MKHINLTQKEFLELFENSKKLAMDYAKYSKLRWDLFHIVGNGTLSENMIWNEFIEEKYGR